MTIIIDASVLLKLLVREPQTETAQAAIDRGNEWIAPDWLMAEVASALSRKVRTEGLSRDRAYAALQAGPAFIDRFVASVPLLHDAFAVSVELGHPLYDCLYLAVALAEKGTMLTADAKFVARLNGSAYAHHVELLA